MKNLPCLPEFNHCFGCSLCRDICPKQAITMMMDKHGFYYPSFNEELCVRCGLCEQKCPAIIPPSYNEEINKACIAIHKDSVVLENSTSGGAFSAIIESWKPDFVYGVRWDGFNVVNDEASSDDIGKFLKSKYVLSDSNGVYRKAALALKSGYRVAFSGSPCQVAAFRNFIGGMNTANLLLIDIVCHGAPSQYLFCLHLLDSKKKIVSWTFRDKPAAKGKVSSQSAKIVYEDGETKHFEMNEDAYLKLYYNRIAYRESCGNCGFANPKRLSDITICDAHHINEVYSKLNVEKGVSCILFHTQKAFELFPKLNQIMDIYDIEYDWVIDHNQMLKQPTTIHPRTKKFYKVIDNGGSFEKAIKKTLSKGIIHAIGSKAKHIVFK